MNTISGTIYALSGDATATDIDGSSRALGEGDGLRAGEAIACGNNAAMLVNTASGEQLSYGPGSAWVVPEAWADSTLEVQSLNPQLQSLDSGRLESQAAHANLYLSSGRAAATLSESLQLPEIETGLLMPDALGDLNSDGASLIEALDSASNLIGALNVALQPNAETNPQWAEEADHLQQLIQRLEELRSSGNEDWLQGSVDPDWLTDSMTPIFTTLEHAEARALEAYSSEVPGGPAWYGNGEPMSFNALGSSHAQNASVADNQNSLLGPEAVETLEIGAVLSSVTEHQLEDVLSFDRHGGQLKVSIQGESASQNASTVAVVLNAEFESAGRAPWDSVFNPGTIGPDQG